MTKKVKIAIDAMGGENAPRKIIEGVKISLESKKLSIPIVKYDGNSVELGKLSGMQYRISTISFTNINDSDIKSLEADLKL